MALAVCAGLVATALTAVGYTASAGERAGVRAAAISHDIVLDGVLIDDDYVGGVLVGLKIAVAFRNTGPDPIPAGSDIVVWITTGAGSGVTVTAPECTALSSPTSCQLIYRGGAPLYLGQETQFVELSGGGTNKTVWYSMSGPGTEVYGRDNHRSSTFPLIPA